MIDLQTIQQVNREATKEAERRGKQPMVFSVEQLKLAKQANDIREIRHEIRHIPNLGAHLPDGWARVTLKKEHGVYTADNSGHGAYFVDATGFGQAGEPALTVGQFIDKLKPGLGYAIVEEGQFQVKIGVFARATNH